MGFLPHQPSQGTSNALKWHESMLTWWVSAVKQTKSRKLESFGLESCLEQQANICSVTLPTADIYRGNTPGCTVLSGLANNKRNAVSAAKMVKKTKTKRLKSLSSSKCPRGLLRLQIRVYGPMAVKSPPNKQPTQQGGTQECSIEFGKSLIGYMRLWLKM